MNFHDLKDIVNIYSSVDGKSDYTWDNAKIYVWNPSNQKEMNLVFTGSERAENKTDYKIHFNAEFIDANPFAFQDAFENTIKKILPNITDEELQEYKTAFLQEIIRMR